MATLNLARPAGPGRIGSMIDHRHAAAALSIAVHVAVMLALLWPAAAARSKDSHAEKGVEVRLIQDDGEGRLKPMADARAEHPPVKPADGPPSTTALSKCDGRRYTGIGVRSWLNGVIFEVASGGPADKAGVRPGDTLLNLDVTEPDRHKPGTRITLRFLRDDREMPPVVAVVEEICYEQPRPPVRAWRGTV